jgi:hypothetical protein
VPGRGTGQRASVPQRLTHVWSKAPASESEGPARAAAGPRSSQSWPNSSTGRSSVQNRQAVETWSHSMLGTNGRAADMLEYRTHVRNWAVVPRAGTWRQECQWPSRTLPWPGTAKSLVNIQRGPADALRARRAAKAPSNPGSFCAALLGSLKYALPADVDEGAWQIALRYFAQRRPADKEFRRLLEQRAGRGGPASRGDAGARVAAVLLREWERYGLVRLLGARRSAGGRGRGGWHARRSAGVQTQQALRSLLRQATWPV